MFGKNTITTVWLMLGDKCNMNCRHCMQAESPKLEEIEAQTLSESMVSYIKSLTDFKFSNEKLTLIFWGGEPLLYLGTMKNVVEQLRSLKDKLNFVIITNGLLLKEGIVNWCNENDIAVVLSNDGSKTESIRRINVLENVSIVENFNNVKRKSISAVISAHNQDYEALTKYLEEKTPEANLHCSTLWCKYLMPDDIVAIDLDKYQESVKKLIDRVYKELLDGKISKEFQYIRPMLNNITNIIKAKEKGLGNIYQFSTCGQTKTGLSVDLQGNIYACHDYIHVIGTILDDHEVIMAKYDEAYNRFTRKEESTCKNCDVFEICRGGCPFVEDSPQKQIICAAIRIFILGVLDLIQRFSKCEIDMRELFENDKNN